MKKIRSIMFMELIFFIYSLSALFSKLASQEKSFWMFIFLYGCNLAMLGIYAILWQQLIKKMKLSIAYANKGVVIIWGIIWGTIIFKEKISIGMIIGVMVIISGIILMMSGESDNG